MKIPIGLCFTLTIASLVLFAFATPIGAQGSGYQVLYSFPGFTGDGAGPWAGLIQDTAGNLYGATSSGGVANGGANVGAVFKLSPPQQPSGNWTETLLYGFCPQHGCADGNHPTAGLIQDDAGNLYGTTDEGGTNSGTVFKLSPPQQPGSSWTETVLHSFCSAPNCADGAIPLAGVIRDAAGNLYGTTSSGGANGPPSNGIATGTVFKLDNTGNETVLYSFCSLANCTDGQNPYAGLIRDAGGNLYGTTRSGGVNGGGTVFKLAPPAHPGGSWTETVLHNFCSAPNCADGTGPVAALIQDAAGNLYGTTYGGGAGANCLHGGGCGTAFRLSPPSQVGGLWTETVLHSFCSLTSCNDGDSPNMSLILDSIGNLYGTTYGGGANDTGGTLFQLDIAGNVTVLHSFCFAANCLDGQGPETGGGLILDAAGILYGTTFFGGGKGGGSGGGTVFKFARASTSIALTSSVNPSVFGQRVTFTATVNVATGTPTGTVQFVIDGSNFGSPVTVSAGSASLSGISTLTVGPHAVSAIYSGDANFLDTIGSLPTQNVNQAASSITVTSDINPAVFGNPVTFTATVSAVPPGSGTPSGTVHFKDGASDLGAGTLDVNGQATLTTSSLSAGAHSITAEYSGDGSFTSSVSPVLAQNVIVATDIAVKLTHHPRVSAIGGRLVFEAKVTNNGPSSANVSFTGQFTSKLVVATATATTGSCTITEVQVSCPLGTISNGNTITVTVTVIPLPLARTIQATAAGTPDITQMPPGDNTAADSAVVKFKPFIHEFL